MVLPSSRDLLEFVPRERRRAAAERARSLKACKLKYKVDVTLVSPRRDGPFFQICWFLQQEINLFGFRLAPGPSWSPCCHPHLYTPAPASSIFQAMWPKMVFGHNLQHMAPFGIPTSGFCMVFQYGSLIFSTPGPILGPQDLDLGSGWAGDLCSLNREPHILWRK